MPMREQSKEIGAAPLKGLALQDGMVLVRGSWNVALQRLAGGIWPDCFLDQLFIGCLQVW